MLEELVLEDHQRFNQLGFQVVKATSGKLYIRSTKENLSQLDWFKSKEKASKEGFSFDSSGYILNYTKPKLHEKFYSKSPKDGQKFTTSAHS